jgi:pyruvate/2-oxoglutarate/acetoin dehydrogenase E1 component
MNYKDELTRAMTYLGSKEDTIFLGQAVESPGTAMTDTLKHVRISKLFEMPVAEEMQMGISIGLALTGLIPVTFYPRWNFLLLAMNQLVNHLDKIPLMSAYRPKVIIRTSVGSERPLHPSFQHVGDYSATVGEMLKTIPVIQLHEAADIFPAYEAAYHMNGSTLLVEYGDYYNEK